MNQAMMNKRKGPSTSRATLDKAERRCQEKFFARFGEVKTQTSVQGT